MTRASSLIYQAQMLSKKKLILDKSDNSNVLPVELRHAYHPPANYCLQRWNTVEYDSSGDNRGAK